MYRRSCAPGAAVELAALAVLLVLGSASRQQPPRGRPTNECTGKPALRTQKNSTVVAPALTHAPPSLLPRITLRRVVRPVDPVAARRALASSADRNAPFNPSVQLQAFGGLQWLGLVQVGIPRQRFTVTMDTGSSDLLVVGWECAKYPSKCLAHPSAAYHPSRCFWPCHDGAYPCKSKKDCPVACTFLEDYGGGDAGGILGMDIVELAGLRVHNFTFGIISRLSLEGANGAWDGILGLTFGNREENRPTPFLSALHENGMLSSRLFTFRLLDPPDDNDPFSSNGGSISSAPVAGSDEEEQSVLELGGMTMVPPNLAVTWAPLIEKHASINGWNVALLRFTIDQFKGETSDYVWAPKICAEVGKHPHPFPQPPMPPSDGQGRGSRQCKGAGCAAAALRDAAGEGTSIGHDRARKEQAREAQKRRGRPRWRQLLREDENVAGEEEDPPSPGRDSVCHAYPDTGTSLIGVPNSTWVVLLRAATHDGICKDVSEGGDPVWECDCERGYDELPTVHFEFVNGSQSMGHDKQGVHIGPTPPNASVVKITLTPGQYMVPRGKGRCIFGFMDAKFMNSKYGGMWLLGDRFLANRYIIYDYDRGYVGFSDSLRTPPSWFERHWQELALACGGLAAFVALVSGAYVWRRQRSVRLAREACVATPVALASYHLLLKKHEDLYCDWSEVLRALVYIDRRLQSRRSRRGSNGEIRRPAVRMTVAIHWSDPLADPPLLF